MFAVGQVQVSRIGVRPLCAMRVVSAVTLVTSAPNEVAHVPLLLSCHSRHNSPPRPLRSLRRGYSPCRSRHGPLSAQLSSDVRETCINGYLDRSGWVMVAIRS
jgi:hypothetical protein